MMHMKKQTNNKKGVQESLSQLEGIVKWFESRRDVDVEEGLAKVKEGVELVKSLRERLKNIQNEFEMVKKELDSHEGEEEEMNREL